MSSFGAFVRGALFGGAIGIVFGLLSAPKAGKELRKELVDGSDTLYRKAAYEIEEIAEHIEDLKHKAEVMAVSTDAAAQAGPVISKAQDAMAEAAQTSEQSHQVIAQTQSQTGHGVR